jgi:putative salt-induced outer membrane protein
MLFVVRCAVRASLFLLVLAAPVVSTGAQEKKPRPREFSADVGFVNTAGNSEVTTFNLGEHLVLRGGRWTHTQQVGSVYARQDGEQTSDLLYGNWRSDYALDKWLAIFAFAGYDRNTFAGISRRFEESLGLSVKLLATNANLWVFEGGVGSTQQRSETDSSRSFASAHSAMTFKHLFTRTAYVFQGLEYLPSLEVANDYRLSSETSIVAPLSAHIAMKIGYTVRYDNVPEPDKRPSDRILTSGLQFNW